VTAATYIGLDMGTSLTKATLWDENGTAVASAQRPTPICHPAPGRTEHDTDAVVATAALVISELVAKGGGTEPALLSVTGQGDGCWLVDDEGMAAGPAISWMDGRATSSVDRWARDGSALTVYQANGNALFPGCMAAALDWMDRQEPERLDRAATAGYCKDVVFQRLTGVRATDPSEASLPFGRPDGTGYAAELLAACGLTHRAGLLAPVVGPVPTAPLDGRGAALTGLAEGTPVASGPFDLAASPLGAGVATTGDGLLIVGTTLGCEVLVDGIVPGDEITGMHLCTGTPGRWVRVLPAMAGCAALDWVLATVGMTSTEVSGAIDRSQPGSGGVNALPYLAPSGERAPFVDHGVTGQFSGLRLSTTRDDLVRAMCEAIAFAALDCFSAVSMTGALTVTGGGARSRSWLQIFADVLDRPLRLSSAPTIGARGALLSALAATGTSVDSEAWAAGTTLIEPDPRSVTHYADLWPGYCANRDAARSKSQA
jgi:erythritol kinase